jgi:hypothetical protein
LRSSRDHMIDTRDLTPDRPSGPETHWSELLQESKMTADRDRIGAAMKAKRATEPTDQDKNARIALEERISRRTVAVVPRVGLEQGSGICVAYKRQHFVVTAAHVVEGLKPQDVYFIAMPDGPLATTPARAAFSERFLPPIVDVTLSPNPNDDLALLRLETKPREMSHMDFLEPQLPEPPSLVRKQVMIHGFPSESMRMMKVEDETAGAVFPYFDYPYIAHVTRRTMHALGKAQPPYHPILHVLLDFPGIPKDSDKLKNPRGLSGGGVWKGPKLNPGALWLPNRSRLAGILIRWSEKRGLLVATRSKRVWALLEYWAKKHHEP